MGIFNRNKKTEIRADPGTVDADALLLSALLSSSTVTKAEALNIPSVQSCINFIADTVCMLPLKLYEENKGAIAEIKDDPRIRLLNDDTGDTLDAVQFWRAILRDYFLGKGGYAYIKKERNSIKSLHYVDESKVVMMLNTDPIFKNYDIQIDAKNYKPFDFVKLLRNTQDGAQGKSIIVENPTILSLAYNSLLFEEHLVKKGGNKKGFLKSKKSLTQEAMDKLKAAWKNLYSNNTESVVILNDGLDFQEASNTSVEMQLNENKNTNAIEICRLFNISPNIINGKATNDEFKNSFKTGVIPVLRAIECACNRDVLLEKEKPQRFWAFDTKEMLKENIKERFEAWSQAIDSNFMQIDEVRYEENLPPLGIKWIKLGLDSVLYDPKSGEIYTPNTSVSQNIGNLEKKKVETVKEADDTEDPEDTADLEKGGEVV
jgi:HK97 family phage portal protein